MVVTRLCNSLVKTQVDDGSIKEICLLQDFPITVTVNSLRVQG